VQRDELFDKIQQVSKESLKKMTEYQTLF